MPKSCCAIRCSNHNMMKRNLTFHVFPVDPARRIKWINAVKRGKNPDGSMWGPGKHTVLCSKHFLSGRPHKDPTHPDFIPSIFKYTQTDARSSESKLRRFAFAEKRRGFIRYEKDQRAVEVADTAKLSPHQRHWDYWDKLDHSYSAPSAGVEVTSASSAERVPLEHNYWSLSQPPNPAASLPPSSGSSVGEQKPIKEEQEEFWEYQEGPKEGEIMAFIVKSEDEETPQVWQLQWRQREEKMTEGASADLIQREAKEEKNGEQAAHPHTDLQQGSDGEVTDCSEEDFLTDTASESDFMNNNYTEEVSRILTNNRKKKKRASHKLTDSKFSSGKTFNSFSESEMQSYSKKKKTKKHQSKGGSTSCLSSDNHSAVRHTSGKPFSCDVCCENFMSKSNLNRHMKLHTRENSFGCDFRGQSFSEKPLRLAHTRVHTGLKPYKCDVCSKCFRWKRTLTSHMKVHTGKKPYGCDICGKVFALKNSLIKHMISHTIQNPI